MTEPEPEPSLFWQDLGAAHERDLAEFGFATVKRHQALRYFTWRWRLRGALRSEQLRFLLRHNGPGSWLTAWRRPERSDSAWAEVDWSTGERRFYTFAVRLLWDYAARHGDRAVLDLPEPLVGAPLPVEARGRLISQDLANSSLEVAAMRRLWSGPDAPRSFLEVGAGYGRTAYVLLSLFPDAVYTIVDIKPAIDISQWYLGQLFPPERLRFVDPSEVDSIETGSIDLALSISSLQEMTTESVASYLGLMDRVASGGSVYLKQWTSWENPDDQITLTFADYPFPTRWRRRFWQAAPVQTTFTEAGWSVPDEA